MAPGSILQALDSIFEGPSLDLGGFSPQEGADHRNADANNPPSASSWASWVDLGNF